MSNNSNVFNTNTEQDVYNKVNLLIRLSDREFGIICSSNKYYNDLCNNSFYSERIFEERTRRLVDNDIIEFKEHNMTWKEFYMRLFTFLPIQKKLIASNFEENYTKDIFILFIEQNKLMEMKMIKTLYHKINHNNSIFDKLYQYDDRTIIYLINVTIFTNRFEILKWLMQDNEHLFDVQILYLSLNNNNNNNEMFKYLYDYFDEETIKKELIRIIEILANDNNIELLNFVDRKGVPYKVYRNLELGNLIYSWWNMRKFNLGTLKWLHSKGSMLTSFVANAAIMANNLPMLQWIHEQGVELPNDIRSMKLTPEIRNWLISKKLL